MTHAEVVETPVKVFPASVLARVAEVVGNVITVESVPEKVSVFVTAKVLRFVIVKVPVEEVTVRPLILVAVATPKTGVMRVGVLASTTAPEPVVEAAEIAVPLPERMPVIVVLKVMAGVVVEVATVPAKPFALTTETLVTVPALEAASTKILPVDWLIFPVIVNPGVLELSKRAEVMKFPSLIASAIIVILQLIIPHLN